MCNTCGRTHKRFKNGKLKKTCPNKRTKRRSQNGEGVVGDISEKISGPLFKLLVPLIKNRIKRNYAISKKNRR